MPSWLWSDAERVSLSPEQKRMYSAEKEENFRWLLKLIGTRSRYTLSDSDLATTKLQIELSEIAQFAEVAHGSMSPEVIWANLPQLQKPGFPFYDYRYLTGSLLVASMRGEVAGLQGLVAALPTSKKLVLAFSGTASGEQAMQDMKFWQMLYPFQHNTSSKTPAYVHSGFWRMYVGVRSHAMQKLRLALEQHEVEEIIFTGHSMGSIMVYYLLLELLDPDPEADVVRIPVGIRLKLAVFGSPRGGNIGLLECWEERLKLWRSNQGDASLVEYSVKGYNDGATALPPSWLGYRHLSSSPLFLYHGHLYHIPESEAEHSIFNVTKSASLQVLKPPDHPLGGHNYYGGRDMEKLQQLMRRATSLGLGTTQDWSDAFLGALAEGEMGWRKKVRSRSW